MKKTLPALALVSLLAPVSTFAADVINAGQIVVGAASANSRAVFVTGDADIAGWAQKAINSHGAFSVKGDAPLKISFTKSGANAVTVTFSGSETWSATEQGTDLMNALWRAIDAAIVQAGKKYAVRPLFAATQLAFALGRGGSNAEICRGDLLVTAAHPLTTHGKRSQSPHWTPAGNSVYYTTWFGSGGADVYRVSLTGASDKIAAFKGTNTGGAVSPDGSRIVLALSPKGTSDIYVADANGKNPHVIVATSDVEMSPCWSPDGASVAYTGGASGRPSVMIVPAAGGRPRKVSTGGYSSEPAWNPIFPTKIAYTVGDHASIGVADINAGGVSPVKAKLPIPVSHPTWCADGRHVVVTLGKDGAFTLGLLDTESGKLVALTGSKLGACFDADARIAK